MIEKEIKELEQIDIIFKRLNRKLDKLIILTIISGILAISFLITVLSKLLQ